MEMITGGLAFATLLFIFMQADRSEHDALFYPRECGYCEMGIHWNKRRKIWLHDDGELKKEFSRYPVPGFTHNAMPYGGVLGGKPWPH